MITSRNDATIEHALHAEARISALIEYDERGRQMKPLLLLVSLIILFSCMQNQNEHPIKTDIWYASHNSYLERMVYKMAYRTKSMTFNDSIMFCSDSTFEYTTNCGIRRMPGRWYQSNDTIFTMTESRKGKTHEWFPTYFIQLDEKIHGMATVKNQAHLRIMMPTN